MNANLRSAALLLTATVALSGAATVLSPAASAAGLPMCDAGHQNQQIGNQVCTDQSGSYRWVTATQRSGANSGLGSLPGSSETVDSATEINPFAPSTTRHYAADGSWSIEVPDSWVASDIGARGQAKLFLHNNESAYTFTIDANAAPIASPERYLKEQAAMLRNSGRVIERQRVIMVKGMKVVQLRYYQADSPENRVSESAIFRTNAPSASRVIYIKGTAVANQDDSAMRMAEQTAMVASLQIAIRR
jgi:hypothetical protein